MVRLMNKHMIQAFIILIIILLGVSLVSESNEKNKVISSIEDFEDKVGNEEEVMNGNMIDVNIIEEDSSNLISDVNSKVATLVVEGLNFVFRLGIKLIERVAN